MSGENAQLPTELESILTDIGRCLEARLYYPALLVTLTIPEICSGLALSRSEHIKARHYIKFVDDYTKEAELGLKGQECYRLRGGIVHRGSATGHKEFGSSHVIFTIPENGNVMHAFSLDIDGNVAAMFDLTLFCGSMCRAAQAWFVDYRSNVTVQDNLKHLLRYRPTGVRPYVAGIPVVASGEEFESSGQKLERQRREEAAKEQGKAAKDHE